MKNEKERTNYNETKDLNDYNRIVKIRFYFTKTKAVIKWNRNAYIISKDQQKRMIYWLLYQHYRKYSVLKMANLKEYMHFKVPSHIFIQFMERYITDELQILQEHIQK